MKRIKHKLIILIGILIIPLSLNVFACENKGNVENYEKANLESVTEEKNTKDLQEQSQLELQSEEKLYVYVCGQVNNPGVYELKKGQRVVDAIAAAGGITEDGDGSRINQALLLKDQDKIYVPDKMAASLSGDLAGSSDGRIDINTASKELLMTLTGIGEARAQSIISYREANGGFKNIEELMEVEGIKSALYNKIRDSITVY